MDNVYRIDVKICATAYIRANSEEEALAKVKQREMSTLLAPEGPFDTDDEIEISEREYGDPNLPEFSLSPAMTFHGAWEDDPRRYIECVHDEDEGEEEEAV